VPITKAVAATGWTMAPSRFVDRGFSFYIDLPASCTRLPISPCAIGGVCPGGGDKAFKVETALLVHKLQVEVPGQGEAE